MSYLGSQKLVRNLGFCQPFVPSKFFSFLVLGISHDFCTLIFTVFGKKKKNFQLVMSNSNQGVLLGLSLAFWDLYAFQESGVLPRVLRLLGLAFIDRNKRHFYNVNVKIDILLLELCLMVWHGLCQFKRILFLCVSPIVQIPVVFCIDQHLPVPFCWSIILFRMSQNIVIFEKSINT